MKIKHLIWLIGGVAICLLAVVALKNIYKLCIRPKTKTGNVINKSPEIKPSVDTEAENLIGLKINVAKSISERHKASSSIIEESLSNINNENADNKVSVSGNEGEFDNMLDELNKLSQ